MTGSLKEKGSCKCSGEHGESICGWNREIHRYISASALNFLESRHQVEEESTLPFHFYAFFTALGVETYATDRLKPCILCVADLVLIRR